MQKISTPSTTSVKTEEKQEAPVLPSKTVINNILAFSKALKVTKSANGKVFEMVAN